MTGDGQAEHDGAGRLSWEVTRTSTGEVLTSGQRDVRANDFEVMITPARPTPRLNRLRLGPRQTAADVAGWLLTRGRRGSAKRLRLGGGFWLELPEQPGPGVPSGLALVASREGESTFSWEWFETGDDGWTATQRQGSGALELGWTLDRHGNHEVASTSFTTDVSLRMLANGERNRSRPTYRVRVLAGSVVRWPRTDDGVRLVPHLRPRPAGPPSA